MFELLNRVPLFSGLSREQLELISQHCTRRSVKANKVLFVENEPGTKFYIVVSGSVKIYTSKGGENKVLAIFNSGDSFGELSLIDGKTRSASAATLEDSVLIILHKHDFINILRQHFDITSLIMQELCNRLRETNEHVHDLTFLDSRTRVLKHLIQMANKHGTRQNTIVFLKIMLDFDELSRMAGVDKDTLMLVIRGLEAKQILRLSDEGFTLDLSKLRQ